MKTLAQFLIGAVIGFIVIYGMLEWKGEGQINWPVEELMVFIWAVALLGIVFVAISIYQMNRRIKTEVVGDEEDLREDWIYKKYGDVSLVMNTSIVLFLFVLCVSGVMDLNQWLALGAIGCIVSYLMMMLGYRIIKKGYPNRAFPNLNDKDYSKKILKMADEGERHVMLSGLYKVFSSVNFLLPVSLVALMIYSNISGQSQIFGMVVITIILIIINIRYFLAIRSN